MVEWDRVRKYADRTLLVAYDGCHKIYMAGDQKQADWFSDPGSAYTVFTGSPDEMVEQVQRWYRESCYLKFVNGVATVSPNPDDGYTDLVPQGADDYEDHEDEEWGEEEE